MDEQGQVIAAVFAVPPHSLGAPFAPATDDERDAELLAYADLFCAALGLDPFDLGDPVADAAYRRRLRELEAERAAHERWWAGVQRRRALYGYGPLARVREWWGERRRQSPQH